MPSMLPVKAPAAAEIALRVPEKLGTFSPPGNRFAFVSTTLTRLTLRQTLFGAVGIRPLMRERQGMRAVLR
jgi:hypothetical protein